MFDKQVFKKNHFIEKIDFAYDLGEVTKPMHIAFNVNDGYFMQAGVAITSIFENNKQKPFYSHIFCDEVNDDNKEKVRKTMENIINVVVFILCIWNHSKDFMLRQMFF